MQLAIVSASAPALKSLISSVRNGTTIGNGTGFAKSIGGTVKGVEETQSTQKNANTTRSTTSVPDHRAIQAKETLTTQSTWFHAISPTVEAHKGKRVLGV